MAKAAKRKEFEDIVLGYADALYNMALKLTKERSTAEDLVQETYEKAYKNFHQFEKGTNIKAWLFTIMTNTYINQYRRKSREPAVLDFTTMDSGDADKETTYFSLDDIDAMKEKLGDEPKRALEKLAPEYRMVFLLSTFEGFSYKEIAEITGCPLGTVMSRLFRAREFMKNELSNYARSEGILRYRN
ncbi:MAG: hypothetical protein A2W23_07685 [Planctomycetes bacterium RBG_16_43_13]|nr:MAG: hypothetical protein A2W23_07685 [Planctomycetes bacterium RBG_16_43_13]